MRNQTANASQDVTQKVRSGQIRFGRLMSPEQVRFSVLGRSGPVGQLSDWCIAIELDRRMFSLMNRAEAWKTSVSIHSIGAQRHFLVTHVIGAWRHHTVLPLVGPTMERFLREVPMRPLCMSLADGKDDDALLIELSVPADLAAGVKSSTIELGSQIEQLTTATMLFAGLMTLPDFQPVDGIDEKAKHICVSVVAPDDFQAMLVLSTCSPESSAMN